MPLARPCHNLHFYCENFVGDRIVLLNDEISGPPFSLLERAAIHSGSAVKAANFFSRSSNPWCRGRAQSTPCQHQRLRERAHRCGEALRC